MVGPSLSDRYVLGDKLATGGMGSIFVATDTRLERRVAIKTMKEELAADPRFVERFRREARSAGALSHPNIAGVFDYGQDGTQHYIVMELVEGRDLARLLREEGPLTEERAARIAAQIADALDHAHAAGVVHRDIKPANVIVGSNDRVKVTDFGIARAQAETSLTATGSFLGTAQYISPEQASSGEIGPSSDIYSLGIVLFEMLTGSVPFTADSAVAVAMRHVSDRVPAPSSLRPDVSSAMDSVVTTATSREPAGRYRDAKRFGDAIRGAITGVTTAETGSTTRVMAPLAGSTAVMTGGEAVATREDWPFPAHPPRWEPRRLGGIVLTIFVILLLIAAGLVLYRLTDDEPRRRARGNQPPVVTEETPTTAETVAIPTVTGSTYEDAAAQLEALGLFAERSEAPNDEYENGVVFDSDPPEGTEVEEGTTVTLFVSGGPAEEDPGEDEDILPEETETFIPPGQEKKEDKEGDD